MLQLSFIKDYKNQIIESLSKRQEDFSPLINSALELDEKRRTFQFQLDNFKAELNRLSKEIGQLYKRGEADKANNLKEQTTNIKTDIKHLETKLQDAVNDLNEVLSKIPNVPHASVISGKSEEHNEEIFRAGTIPQLDENAMPHWELAAKYKLIDFELGAKITGSGFPVYLGKGAKLQRALIAYFLDKNTAAGYREVQVPHLVNEASGFGTGQLPDKEGQMYEVTNISPSLYLIPTAEVPATNIYRDVILSEAQLPQKLTAYTPCFRREAGSYGAHVRGLNRLHQFDKVEILRVEYPDNSYNALNDMVSHVKSILNELKLPYRILRLCGGDLGFTAALTYDFEVFSTAQNRWLEISSVSNFESYQANRLKLRFKNAKGKSHLCHTLNGSALALPRVMAGILENYQTNAGIKIPEVLVPYTGFEMID